MIPAEVAAFGPIGLGAAPLGNLFTEVSDADAEATVDAAWAAGVRYFDTAPHYGLGLAEYRLGRALAKYPREEYVISTKVGRLLRPNPRPEGRDDEGYAVPDDLHRVRDYSPEGVRASLAESLGRLWLDRVDIVYIHDPDDHYDAALAGSCPTLSAMRDAGQIRAWGVGMNQSALPARFAVDADPDLIMLAGRYTLLDQGAEDDLLGVCRDLGIGVVAVGVFNSGLLATDRPAPDATFDYRPAQRSLIERAMRIAEVCERHGTTLPAAAIAFARTEPAVVNVTLGMRTPEQVRRNAELAARGVPDDLWPALRQAGLLRARSEGSAS